METGLAASLTLVCQGFITTPTAPEAAGGPVSAEPAERQKEPDLPAPLTPTVTKPKKKPATVRLFYKMGRYVTPPHTHSHAHAHEMSQLVDQVWSINASNSVDSGWAVKKKKKILKNTCSTGDVTLLSVNIADCR